MFQMKKVLAGLTSTILTVAACAAISIPSYAAEVYTPTATVSGTFFQYNLSVEYLHAGDLMDGSVAAQEGDVAVSFNCVQNAGLGDLAFYLYYDGGYDAITDKGQILSAYNTLDWCGTFSAISHSATEHAIHFAAGHANGDYSDGTGGLKFYFRPNSNYVKGKSGFTLALTDYRGVDGSFTAGNITTPSIEIPGLLPYILGDVDNNQKIELDDATITLTVASSAPNTTVSYLNNHLSEWLPDAVCAESADVDFDQRITKDDAQGILDYYADSSVNVPLDSLIGKTYFYIVKA